jgi:hypothetical protein
MASGIPSRRKPFRNKFRQLGTKRRGRGARIRLTVGNLGKIREARERTFRPAIRYFTYSRHKTFQPSRRRLSRPVNCLLASGGLEDHQSPDANCQFVTPVTDRLTDYRVSE